MNPFAGFSFQEDAQVDLSLPCRAGLENVDRKRKGGITEAPDDFFSVGDSKRLSKEKKKPRASKPSDPKLMIDWWEELKCLTSSYPFAVMITSVLGSQCRDIVTIGAMRNLAKLVNNDLSPQSISALPFVEIEEAIKTLNYCKKKAALLQNLALKFSQEPVPSTSAGLLKVHGKQFFVYYLRMLHA